MDTGSGEKLLTFDDAMSFDNGETVAFTVKTVTGKQLRINCTLPELGDIFQYLALLAKEAGSQSNAPAPTFPHGYRNDFSPIPALGVGFQAGENPSETILVVRLAGFDFGFAVPSSALAALADDIARIARTLSADGKQIQ